MDIHELKDDNLEEIFLYSLPARDEIMREEVNPNRSISTPLHISHVCRRWRKVSLAFGGLWSHLFIKYVSRERNNINWSAKALEIFNEWLERTGEWPLNFTIHCHLRREESENRAFESIITTLLSKQERWRDVDFWWNCVKVSSDFPGMYVSKIGVVKIDDSGRDSPARFTLGESESWTPKPQRFGVNRVDR